MGGDNAPGCTVQGALEALRLNPSLKLTLAGVEKEILPRISHAECVESVGDSGITHGR